MKQTIKTLAADARANLFVESDEPIVSVIEAAITTAVAIADGRKDAEITTLCEALDKAHALLSVVAGVVRDREQRMPVGVHAPDGKGIARYLTASFVQKCADWCEGEYSPHEESNVAP